MSPAAIARCAAAITGAGVGKSGSPISMCTTERPAASSARAAVCTSITWKGAISATRAAVATRESIESRRADRGRKRYRTASTCSDQRIRPKFVRRIVHAAMFCALTAPASAQVWKCAGEHDQPVYQDSPCPPGRELRNFAADPATVSVIPVRPVPGTTTRVVVPATPRIRNPDKKEKLRAGDPAERRYLALGMHEGEVFARVGPPDLKSGGGNRKLARWTYLPPVRDPQTITTVVFDSGKVIEVERKVVK